ncbi:MAG: AAA family ATPase [Acholeplasmatales bacterium]|nr:AAA family ATPase [Acholeplasmatales bacterium]
MKLLSLYVDNFGKLSNFAYDFKSTLNTVYEENGFGKTTLAAFIKAMLYGLTKEERLKYTPWTKMTGFGGYLVYEVDNKSYRVERTFSPKRAAFDTVKIVDLETGTEEKLKDEIGEEYLNLNEESFERSVYIPQKNLEEGFGSDIEAELANIIGGTDDSQSYNEAMEILTRRSEDLLLNTKKGIIVDKKRELFELDSELSESELVIKAKGETKRNIDLIDAELEFLEQRRDIVKDQLVEYTKSQEKKAKLQVITKYDNDLEAAKRAVSENNAVFNGNQVTLDEIKEARNKNRNAQRLRFEYEILRKNVKVPEKYNELTKTYNKDTVPTDEKVEDITRKIEKYKNILSVIEAHRVVPKEDKPVFGIVFTALATLFLVVGLLIGSFYFYADPFMVENTLMYIMIGGGILTASIICYIMAFIGYRRTLEKNTNKFIGGNVKAYDFEKIQLEEALREFFGKFHLYSSNFQANMEIVVTNTEKYKEYQKELIESQAGNEELEKKIKSLDNEIQHFLSQFVIDSVYISTEERIAELTAHLNAKEALEAKLAEAQKAKDSYVKSNELYEISDIEVDVDKINDELKTIDDKITDQTNNRAAYVSKLKEIERESSSYTTMKQKKSSLETEIKQLENEHRILNLSMKYLNLSQTALLEQYVKPMKDSASKYIKMLFSEVDDFSIDVNFKFKFQTKAGLKELDSASAGYQAAISLCMRLALIDCLYPKEKPFIVLDDPFVNFDDAKLGLVASLIKKISKKYQIVYFTCHESRKF